MKTPFPDAFRKWGVWVLLAWSACPGFAQELGRLSSPRIYFPYPINEHRWYSSIGLAYLTTPRDITEEVRIRAPAIDFHVLRRLPGKFYLDGRIISQVLQNHFSLGPRWAHPLSNRLSMSVGDDTAFWFGFLSFAGFNSKAHGWVNYPNLSLGYRVKDDLLLTLKAEAVINFAGRSYTGDKVVDYKGFTYNGLGFTLTHEQPLYKQKFLTLGFRALYTNFNWQLWALYETFDRKIFYPEFIIGFIL